MRHDELPTAVAHLSTGQLSHDATRKHDVGITEVKTYIQSRLSVTIPASLLLKDKESRNRGYQKFQMTSGS